MENFEILEKLGEGSFSIVYKAKRKIDNQIYALKRVKLKNLKQKNILNSLNEIRVLASIKSNYVISYKEAFYEEKDNSLIIIMEYADNGDLYKKIKYYKKNNKYFDEDEIWTMFIQLIKGLKSLHDLNIIHRDIKSANIFLFKNGMIKLGDLNVSKVAKKGLSYTQTGTPNYAAPEIWKDLPYNYKSDIWSLGCVLYEMITLNLPFENKNGNLYDNIIKGEIKNIPDRYSKDLNNIIHLLIQVNKDKRPSCNELLNNQIIKNKIEYLKNINLYNNLEDNSLEKSFLLKTIEMPKNMVKTPLKFPEPNYSIKRNDKNNKLIYNLKNNRNNRSNQLELNKSYDYNYNDNILPMIIKNTKKNLIERNNENFMDKYGFQRIINKNLEDNINKDDINNKKEMNNYNNNNNNNKNLLNNFNYQWMKMRNSRKKFNAINNNNKYINNNSESMKIMKLYKPFNIYNNEKTVTRKSNYLNTINDYINKSKEEALPIIKGSNNKKKIYLNIKIIPNRNEKK
jgi:NIMA (never in mitosis gene a)-related kinase